MENDKEWLENAIYDFVENNPNVDSVDIVSHFKLRADITMNAIQRLINCGKMSRIHLYGFQYGHQVNNPTCS